MATTRKKEPAKKSAPKKVATVRDEELTALDVHAIQLHELYKAYRRAGFDVANTLTLITSPDAHPDWFMTVPDLELLEDEEEDD